MAAGGREGEEAEGGLGRVSVGVCGLRVVSVVATPPDGAAAEIWDCSTGGLIGVTALAAGLAETCTWVRDFARLLRLLTLGEDGVRGEAEAGGAAESVCTDGLLLPRRTVAFADGRGVALL